MTFGGGVLETRKPPLNPPLDFIEKVTKNLQSTTLIANDAHFEVRKLNNKLALQEKLTKALEATVDDLQGRLRRNTLVFRGIPEGTEENASWSSCKILINSILLKYFNIENVNIERAHRSPAVRDPNKETALNYSSVPSLGRCKYYFVSSA